MQETTHNTNTSSRDESAGPIYFQIALLRNQRNLFFITSVGLLFIAMALSLKVALSSNQTIIIPMERPESSMIYDPRHISEEHITGFSLSTLSLLLDISPETIDHQHGRLQPHFLPGERESLVHVIRRIKKDLTEKHLSTFFVPHEEEIKISVTKREVVVPGILKTLTSNTITSEQPKIYKITYQFYHGRIYISSILEVEPENPK